MDEFTESSQEPAAAGPPNGGRIWLGRDSLQTFDAYGVMRPEFNVHRRQPAAHSVRSEMFVEGDSSSRISSHPARRCDAVSIQRTDMSGHIDVIEATTVPSDAG